MVNPWLHTVQILYSWFSCPVTSKKDIINKRRTDYLRSCKSLKSIWAGILRSSYIEEMNFFVLFGTLSLVCFGCCCCLRGNVVVQGTTPSTAEVIQIRNRGTKSKNERNTLKSFERRTIFQLFWTNFNYTYMWYFLKYIMSTIEIYKFVSTSSISRVQMQIF